jgi:hypothetical protein
MKTKLYMTTAVAAVAAAGLMVSPLLAADETGTQLQAQAKITKADAQTTALAKVPDGTIQTAELEKEHSKLIWSFDIAMPRSKNITEVQVDAKTGKIVSVQVETPQDQAKEGVTDQKNKR